MREESIFHEALSREGEERAAYLTCACKGDKALRRRVDVLLKAHAEPQGFLQNPNPMLAATLAQAPTKQLLGQTIGPFKIREQIGEGGMGIVFAAEQTEPVRRKVALKVIKPGQASHDVIARFEAERQALAVMDHPNIARIFDGGTTKIGLPYFVMELVQGLPITDYCNRYQLDLDDRLELFRRVCDAVHHAHQKGVIHRDIKPSNVLVPRIDGVGMPKVIDFGIAKAINQKLTDRTLYTQFSQMVGSPLYMSPEQAELGVVDIDTRSDVYALGVLLYELLTGSTPIDRQTLEQAGFDEMRRIIREDDPPTPSLRVSTLNAQQASTLQGGPLADVRQFASSLKNEVDWIVMKALEKDRFRRYQSAAELAADIQRYLNNEPVTACPPSLTYRLRKYTARHRARVALLATVALGVILGVVGLVVSNLAIREQRDRAETLKFEAQALQSQTLQQKQVAEENLNLAKDAVDAFVTRFANELTAYPDTDTLRKRLLTDALVFHRRFVDQDAESPQARFEAAHAAIKVGDIHSFLGEPRESIAAYEQAAAIFKKLVADEPAPKYLNDQLTVQSKIANIRFDIGQTEKSLVDYNRAIERARELFTSDSSSAELELILAKQLMAKADALRRLQKIDKATVCYEEALELLSGRLQDDAGQEIARVRGSAHNSLGLLLLQDNSEEAREHFEKSMEITKGLLVQSPGTAEYLRDMAGSLNNLGICYGSLGDPDGEENVRREALRINRELFARFPNSPVYQARLADALKDVAAVGHKGGRTEKASREFTESIKMSRDLVQRYPDYREHHRLLARGLLQYSELLVQTSRLEEAQDRLEESYGICKERLSESTTGEANLMLAELLLAIVHARQGESEPARPFYDSAVARRTVNPELTDTPYFEQAGQLLNGEDPNRR